MMSALVCLLGSGVIHQRITWAASFGRSLPKDLYVNFVDESGRLKGMIGSFPPQLVGGHAPKVTVQQVEKPAFRGSIPAENSLQ